MRQILTVLPGDCRQTLAALPAVSVDSCVTDPPYELGFMGKAWDKSGIAYDPAVWREVFRVLKPGAYLLAFGGTRTYHRMVVAIEDAGFEIRDQIGWLYGSGFPKSLDVSKAIDKAVGNYVPGEVLPSSRDSGISATGIASTFRAKTAANPQTPAAREWSGWGTALKPAWEPICIARKPFKGTVAENVQKHGTGALNIDGCRVATGDNLNGGAYTATGGREALAGDEREGAALGMFQTGKTAGRNFEQPAGRWPANIIHDGSEEVLAAFPIDRAKPAAARAVFKHQSGIDRSGNTSTALGAESRPSGSVVGIDRGDTGSAARFFYTAKASKSDRGTDNQHPTVKPVSLMRYLCRLVTRPGGTILDCFAGSGTTARAAIEEGFQVIAGELDPEHCDLIRRRCEVTPGFNFSENEEVA